MLILNNMILNTLWANYDIKEEIKKYLKTKENGNTMIYIMDR